MKQFTNGSVTVSEPNSMLYNVWERMGFTEVIEQVKNSEPTIDEMKQALKDAGVEFHHKLGAEKITELYKQLA